MRFLYALLSRLLLPVFILYLLWRSRRQPGYRRRLGERLGYGHEALAGPSIWIHAVSVGEVTAAAPLLRLLQEHHPDVPVVVTTMTPTGSERARDLFGDAVVHAWVPYDSPGAVRRFFNWARPRLVVILETEIWPNLYHECGRRGVALVLANARVSEKSLRLYRILFGLIRDTLAHGIVIGAQSAADAERFLALGSSPQRTHVTGNIKFDFELGPEVISTGQAFRREQAANRPVWIAASTHQGEEEIIIEAHRQVLRAQPEALLVLVPRHPERFASVAGMLERAGLGTVRRSSGQHCDAATQVFLGDSMGELTMFYAASDVAFVGGSLVPVGGHNLLEPAALAVPALSGPYNFNARDIAEQLLARDALILARNSAEIATQVLRLLADPAKRLRHGRAGAEVLAANRGTVNRLLELMEPLAISAELREASPVDAGRRTRL